MEPTPEEVQQEGGAVDRGRWGAAIGLSLVVLLLSVFDPLALVLLPLAILFVGIPSGRNVWWVLAGTVIWVIALVPAMSTLSLVARAWALIAGASYLSVTIARPGWAVTSRALFAIGTAMVGGAVGLSASGFGTELDRVLREHFLSVATMTVADLQTRMPNATWLADLRVASERIASLQADMFPALLALQTLAALALATWWVRRLGRSDDEAFALRPLREFRFNDQLIWMLIAGLVLAMLPFGGGVTRFAYNLLVFMAALYAVRGLAVFVFLAVGSRSVATIVFGALALVFLYQVAFTAALLMGVGDTWLDVRRRVATANPT
jgi:hypothetical protein